MTRLLIRPNSTQRRSRWRKMVGLGAGLIIGLAVVVTFLLYESPESRLRRVLKLEAVPASVQRIEANEEVWSDSVTRLYLELDAKDLPQLLQGRGLQNTGRKDSQALDLSEIEPGLPARTASEFYEAQAPGMRVSLATDKSNNWAYIVYFVD